MTKKILTAVLGTVLAATLWACGGAEKKTQSAAEQSATGQETPSAQSMETPRTEAPADTPSTPPARLHQTVHDANATYGEKDLPVMGSYLKLDFTDLTPAQLNRVIHRLRTEFCTCGCENDPIDACLVNDPNCGTAVTLANQIIREEKMKS